MRPPERLHFEASALRATDAIPVFAFLPMALTRGWPFMAQRLQSIRPVHFLDVMPGIRGIICWLHAMPGG
jgi:hypothetical protein